MVKTKQEMQYGLKGRRGRPRKSAVPIVECDFEIIDSEDSDIEMPPTLTRSRFKYEQEVY